MRAQTNPVSRQSQLSLVKLTDISLCGCSHTETHQSMGISETCEFDWIKTNEHRLQDFNRKLYQTSYIRRTRVAQMSQVVRSPNNSYRPITNTAWVDTLLCKLKKGCTRLAAGNDQVYQLLAHGWQSFTLFVCVFCLTSWLTTAQWQPI